LGFTGKGLLPSAPWQATHTWLTIVCAFARSGLPAAVAASFGVSAAGGAAGAVAGSAFAAGAFAAAAFHRTTPREAAIVNSDLPAPCRHPGRGAPVESVQKHDIVTDLALPAKASIAAGPMRVGRR
jgi:hypothetical protein